ncbi:peptidoglycan-binding protein [Micromonospora sp. C51]|uniref:peptidoglycan-binding domain-containing protein n=1 Tax=Micromonospora sp. C51 TaxID=2824879 RepID=UPI0035AF826C
MLVAWGHQFRKEMNALAPKRDKSSDGSIGNTAHQSYPSGHNPDETGNPERHDADNINEVRAIDVDADFRVPGLSAQMVVAYLVGRCRAGKERRLIYIIYNRTIWSASSGWQARKYTGSNPHTSHIHLSGHPDGDDDGRPFGLASVMPKPKPAAGKPAPGPAIKFPLPAGYYFGPKTGPANSVSGHYGRKFAGHTDRYWLQRWAIQLGKRGWAIGKGKTWLRRHGNDGRWGPEYQALVKRFQADQRLTQDGKLGPRTWDAAFRNPIR